MKHYLPAVMILTAMAPVASAEATISLGYCMLCADFPKKKKKEASATAKKNMPTITPVNASTAATFRSEFIPWPTKAMLQRTSPPISRELAHFFDFSAPLTEPLATSIKQRSVSSTRHKSTSQKRSKFDDIPKQQQQHQQQHNEEEPFFPLFFIVAASLLAFNVIAAAAEFIFRYAEKEEKEDKISSDVKGEDFDCLGLAPTVEDEEDEEQEEEDVSVCKVDTIEIKRQDEMSRDKTLEKDSSVPQQEQVSISSVDNCLGYTCTNTFEEKVSVEILKFLLEDRVEKYDKANVVMVEEEEEEDVCQDKADNSSSAITIVSDEVDTIIAPPSKKKSVVGPWWDLFSHCNAAVGDESDDEQSMKSVLL